MDVEIVRVIAEVRCPHCAAPIEVEMEPSWSTAENDHIGPAWEKHKPGNCLAYMQDRE